MDRLEKIYRLHTLLRARRYPVSFAVMQETLGCSRATLRRLMTTLRDHFQAPLIYDRKAGGYRYDTGADECPFELPGLWFSADELHALLAAQQWLESIGHGLLGEQIAPLRQRIEALIARASGAAPTALGRIRILAQGRRRLRLPAFSSVAAGVLGRRKLRIVYHGRARDATTEREISPQRLTHYRDNWYLDAWCHRAQALRVFAVDRIERVAVLDEAAADLPDAELDAHLASAYGIFAGPATAWAVLRFTAARARWVAEECWHPEQESRWLDDGRYELRLPYGDTRELCTDILKYGADVEVIAPPALRKAVADALRAAHEIYAQARDLSL
ncbi:helix-turn-helix transcriptional regulator [Acidihalobacter ferrooxydans]|uniref:Transcriptional regulator n=1 Tax=Acidihalobacter ferrooxydans TaxID=1765967 RepID=A0A1P8UKE8_9GAMM|nr:WYL domain-containing protein [Acidihalobacter ferrooxydans]APZ44307.1 hypothetical protein BW247_15400 [Acidihalobacter ferrooxydans]